MPRLIYPFLILAAFLLFSSPSDAQVGGPSCGLNGTPSCNVNVTGGTGSTVTANQGTPNAGGALAWPVTDATTQTDIGPPGATACATDTGSCSLNALLQRIAQRISTLITGITNTIVLQAGSNIIGNVRIDQTTPGTTNAVVPEDTAGNSATFSTAGADGVSNTLNTYPATSRLSGFNGTTWDRLKTNPAANTITGFAPLTAGSLAVTSILYGTDGTNENPAVVNAPFDTVSNGTKTLWTFSENALYNGTTWDRQRGTGGVAQVGGSEFNVPTIPTVTASSYVAGKCMGGVQAVAVARSSGIGGILNKIIYTSKAGSTAAITFYVFKSSPTTSCADTATFTLNSADLSLLVGVYAISPAVIPNQTQSYTELANLGASFVPSGNSNIYVYIVSNATQTPGSTTDIVFNLIGLQD